jgi:hypothetical protein
LILGDGLGVRHPEGGVNIAWRRELHIDKFPADPLGKILERVVDNKDGWLCGAGRSLR